MAANASKKRLLASVLQVASAKLLFFWHLAGLADQRPSTEIKVLRGLAAAILGRPGASRDCFGSGAEQQFPASAGHRNRRRATDKGR